MNNEIKVAQEAAYKAWEKHVSNQFMLYPNEYLTRFIYKHKFNSMLDYGCGDGRHTQMIAISGAKEVIAVDISKQCVDMVSKRCENLSAVKTFWLDPKSLNSVSTPPHGLKFLIKQNVDCVVCFEVLHVNKKDTVTLMLNEFNSVLNEGGRLFTNWRTKDDSLYKSGEEISENLFMLKRKSRENMLDMLYYFPSLDEIKQMYREAGFEILSVDIEEFTTDNMQVKNSFF